MGGYLILIQRDHEVKEVNYKDSSRPKEGSTVGYLSIMKEGKFIFDCYTIENIGPSTDTPNKDRRIMPGSYGLMRSITNVPLPKSIRQRGLLLIKKNDHNFSKRRIFIHVGNYPQETLGCILLNEKYNEETKLGYGLSSIKATQRFYNILRDVDLKQVTLKISDIESI